MILKQRYMGVFNWHGEIHKFWCWAYSENQAKYNFIHRLANKLGRTTSKVGWYFSGPEDNCQIKEVGDGTK